MILILIGWQVNKPKNIISDLSVIQNIRECGRTIVHLRENVILNGPMISDHNIIEVKVQVTNVQQTHAVSDWQNT